MHKKLMKTNTSTTICKVSIQALSLTFGFTPRQMIFEKVQTKFLDPSCQSPLIRQLLRTSPKCRQLRKPKDKKEECRVLSMLYIESHHG